MKSLFLIIMLLGFSSAALACPDTDPACFDDTQAGVLIIKGVKPVVYTHQICTASWG